MSVRHGGGVVDSRADDRFRDRAMMREGSDSLRRDVGVEGRLGSPQTGTASLPALTRPRLPILPTDRMGWAAREPKQDRQAGIARRSRRRD